MALVAIGGFFGAIARFLLSKQFPQFWGTFIVNVLGSFCIGLCLHLAINSELYSLIVIGFLGAFTTFSTFTYEVLQMLKDGCYNVAIIYMASSTIICLAATASGFYL